MTYTDLYLRAADEATLLAAMPAFMRYRDDEGVERPSTAGIGWSLDWAIPIVAEPAAYGEPGEDGHPVLVTPAGLSEQFHANLRYDPARAPVEIDPEFIVTPDQPQPTTTVAVTRPAEVATLDLTALAPTRATLLHEVELLHQGAQTVLTWSDGTADEHLRFRVASSRIRAVARTGGSDVADLNAGLPPDAGVPYRIVFAAQTDDYRAAIGGALVTLGTGGNFPTGLDTLIFGAGYHREVGVWTTALQNDLLTSLS